MAKFAATQDAWHHETEALRDIFGEKELRGCVAVSYLLQVAVPEEHGIALAP